MEVRSPQSPRRSDRPRFTRSVELAEHSQQLAALPVRKSQPRISIARIVAARDAVHRRALAFADAIAAMLAFSIALSAMGANQLRPASVAIIPVVLIVGKMCGLYDRDEL